MRYTVVIYVDVFMLENREEVAQVALFKGVGMPFEFCAVFLSLLGGLGFAYGASQLIGRSSPSAEVYQWSQYGTVSGSLGGTTPTV